MGAPTRYPSARRRYAWGAAALAAVVPAAAALLSGLRPGPAAALQPPPLAGWGLTPTQPQVATRIARQAGNPGKPGGRPGVRTYDDIKEALEGRLRKGVETEDIQMERVAAKSKWLKSLKGKFVPYGPKPWDKPMFKKVCIQVRLQSKQASNTKLVNQCVEELRRISGKHPRVIMARHNVAQWGWRKGFPCGVGVNMYGQLMRDFLYRLNTIVLPRVRDFEGLNPSSFDNMGNFWMGFDSQEPFKELDEMIDSRELVHGFDVGLINNCLTQPQGLKLMKEFGFPFGDPTGYNPVKIKRKWSAPKR